MDGARLRASERSTPLSSASILSDALAERLAAIMLVIELRLFAEPLLLLRGRWLIFDEARRSLSGGGPTVLLRLLGLLSKEDVRRRWLRASSSSSSRLEGIARATCQRQG